MLTIENHGPLILRTNYWELPEAAAGKLLVSLNAGAFRVLLPPTLEAWIAEMATAKEVLISRGPWPAENQPDGFEVLFDDRTSYPFALHLSVESFDRLPTDADQAGQWVLTVWTQSRRNRPHRALERPCWYRRVPRIPWLKPR